MPYELPPFRPTVIAAWVNFICTNYHNPDVLYSVIIPKVN